MKPRTMVVLAALALQVATGLASHAGTLVRFRTVFGDMLVELLDEEKPATVANFLRYVESGRWTHLFTHRIAPGFVAQAGAFVVLDDPVSGPGFVRISDFGRVTNEFNTGPRRSNVYGTIAMAKKAGDPNSATTDWFFNLADNSAELDVETGGYTVFGRVLSGTNVLEAFNGFTWRLPLAVQSTNRLYYLGESGPFNLFPLPPSFPSLNPLESAAQAVTNVVHLGIEVIPLQAHALSGRQAGVGWTGIPGITNRVEVAGSLTDAWTTLTNLVPAVGSPEVVDPSPGDGPRYYRIRIGDGIGD